MKASSHPVGGEFLPESPGKEATQKCAASSAANFEAENCVLRKRIEDLERELERQAVLAEMKATALENKVQVVREMISFQLGAAILDVLKSPAKAFALPSILWRIHLDAEKRRNMKAQREEIALRGPKFQQLLQVIQGEGMAATMSRLSALGLSTEAVGATLSAMSRELASSHPALSIDVARAAFQLDSKPHRAKWLAFRLYDRGCINEPADLLAKFSAECVLSASELKRASEISDFAELKHSLPGVPPRAESVHPKIANSILYVAASAMPYHTTGYATRTQELLVALKNSGTEITALTRPGYPWDRADRSGLPLERSTTFEGVTYLHIKSPTADLPTSLYIEGAARAVEDVARKRKVSAIHAASNYANALPALFAARNLGIPFSYEMRGLWNLTRAAKIPDYEQSEHYQLQMELEALVARNADKLYVISKALGKVMEEAGVQRNRIHVLPNCVNLQTIEKARQSAGPKLKSYAVGYAGSLVGYEGLDLLIEALAQLKDRGFSIHARIIGDGPCRNDLVALASKKRLSGQIEFLGRLHPDQARARLMETHAVVLPRRPDKVCDLIPPIKLAEALAMNLPVIASDVTAMRIELEGCQDARLFKAGSVTGLAECLEAEFRNFSNSNHFSTSRDDAPAIRTWSDYVPEILSVLSTQRSG